MPPFPLSFSPRELTGWEVAGHIATLAAAYNEAGDFDSAVKWPLKANALYTDAADKKIDEALLETYMESLKAQEEKKATSG